MAEDTLVDQWIARAKNHPVIATMCLLAIALGSLAAFTDSINTLKEFFSGQTQPTSSPTVIVSPSTPPPPKKLSNFREEFELGEQDTFVSNHGVTVATNRIYVGEEGLVADVGASATGSVEWFDTVRRGEQIKLLRADCKTLMVVVRDIQLTKPNELTWELIRQLGPVGEALVTRKVTGTVTGRCEE